MVNTPSGGALGFRMPMRRVLPASDKSLAGPETYLADGATAGVAILSATRSGILSWPRENLFCCLEVFG